MGKLEKILLWKYVKYCIWIDYLDNNRCNKNQLNQNQLKWLNRSRRRHLSTYSITLQKVKLPLRCALPSLWVIHYSMPSYFLKIPIILIEKTMKVLRCTTTNNTHWNIKGTFVVVFSILEKYRSHIRCIISLTYLINMHTFSANEEI